MIDWRSDVEQKMNNLLRSILQDIAARGDKRALADKPRVERLDDGSYRVVVFAHEEPQKTTKKSSKKKDVTD